MVLRELDGVGLVERNSRCWGLKLGLPVTTFPPSSMMFGSIKKVLAFHTVRVDTILNQAVHH